MNENEKQHLVNGLRSAILSVCPENSVGIAFSGGVDSALLAKLCIILKKKITLLTVGFPGSHDLRFSSQVAAEMNIDHKSAEIAIDDFRNDVLFVQKAILCPNTSHIENCVAYRSIARLARKNDLEIVLSANGCDELFCGYNAYRAVYHSGEAAILELMQDKIRRELELVNEINTAVSDFRVSVRQPFLSDDFILLASSIPLDGKIRGSDDMLRKHSLRQIALELGVPEKAALKPKKALQYGSHVDKNFKAISRAQAKKNL